MGNFISAADKEPFQREREEALLDPRNFFTRRWEAWFDGLFCRCGSSRNLLLGLDGSGKTR
jgi:hypothetical protein